MNNTYAKQLAAAALLSLSAISVQAAPETVCSGTAANNAINGGSGAVSASAGGFFQQGFTVQCSNNVLASINEVSANLLAVAAGSTKGNQSFAGNSNGGAITTHAKCVGGTNNSCTTSDVSTALSAAAGST